MPNQVDEGFKKADSSNFPKIDILMVYNYICTDERHNAPEVRGVKTTSSSRQNYGDSAIGYVCVKRDDSICILKGKICPEHRVREKSYDVLLMVNEVEERVISVKCLGCAASQGGCKHGIAFLFWANRRSESAALTEIECYWRKPPLSKIGTSKKFITVDEMIKKERSTPVNLGDDTIVFKQVMEQAKSKQLDSQLSRYHFDRPVQKFISLSIHQLIFEFCEEDVQIDFMLFAKNKITERVCEKIEEVTRDQKDNFLWHELRFGRITASNIYEASRCETTEGSLVHRVIDASKVYDNIYMERGRRLEQEVIHEIEKKLNLRIKKCGLFLLPSLPILGASSDGVGSDFVVEIKCPSSLKTVENYLPKRNHQ